MPERQRPVIEKGKRDVVEENAMSPGAPFDDFTESARFPRPCFRRRHAVAP
jgi:hypothetical protein